jgi:hypothetical protein
MNGCLAEIGIHLPKLRKRAIAIGEKLGIYRDYPCSKGCTSPFAPIWIKEMVKGKGERTRPFGAMEHRDYPRWRRRLFAGCLVLFAAAMACLAVGMYGDAHLGAAAQRVWRKPWFSGVRLCNAAVRLAPQSQLPLSRMQRMAT